MSRWLHPGDFVRGLLYPVRGLVILRRHGGLARYWVPPIVLTFTALVASVVLSVRYSDDIVNLVWGMPSGDDWLSRLLEALHVLLRSLAVLVGFALSLVAGILLANLFAAPFNDALSAAIEERETGVASPPFSLSALLHDLARTLRLELLKLLIYVGVLGPLLIVSWLVPGVGSFLYSAFAALFTVVYFALDYLDWPAARRGYSVRRRIALLSVRPLTTLGFGVAVSICLFIPLLNLFLMPLAVAGGTRLFLDLSAYAEQDA
jgi:CysZ protein